MSIKTKTITLLLISLLVTGLVVGASGMYVLYGKTLDGTQIDMNGQALELAGEVSELFSSFNRSGKFYAEDPDLKSGDASRIQGKIDTYFAATWGADHLVFINSAGTRIATTPYEVKAIGASLADRKFFKDTMNDQKSHISDVLINRATGVPSVVVTQPVKGGDGKMVGMIAQSVDLATLQNFLAQIKVGQTGVIAIVARDGSLLAHTNSDLLKEQKKIPENTLQTVINDPGHLTSYQDLAGRESLVLAVPVKNTDWLVLVSLPKSEIKSDFYASLISMTISLLITLLIVGFVAWIFLMRLLRPIEEISKEVAKIGDGDLSVSISHSSNDEIGILARAVSSAIENFRKMIVKVQEASEMVSASSEELTANTEQLAQAADQVSTAIADVANGTGNQMQAVDTTMNIVEQMSAGLQQIAANTGSVSATAEKTSSAALEGGKAVQKVTSQMANIETSVNNSAMVVAKLGERSKEIGQIVDTISGIAGQTNLLALNAAIEAARAGEQGRGFAVVAEEVRKLAEQSSGAAKEIATLIGEIQGDTDKAVMVMNEGTNEVKKGTEVAHLAGQSFVEIASLVENVSDEIRGISAAIEEMAGGSQQIVSSVKDIAQISKATTGQTQTVSAATEEQSASIQEIASSSTDLSTMAGDLQAIVSKFRI
ncbi:methyl-accepting chemotaxis protein [Pelosinus sp. sgz500959]|uniref:methyl-accepting chemotaxis protein n=1 Tax=Pelosinus sp. sgz500959 TaxID=3242472 RepID=UPI00366D7811